MKYHLTTTIDLLRERGACVSRFLHLLRTLNCIAATAGFEDSERELVQALQSLSAEKRSRPISLLTILSSNGLDDCLWAIDNATVENSAPALAEYDRVMASALAEYDRVAASALAEILCETEGEQKP